MCDHALRVLSGTCRMRRRGCEHGGFIERGERIEFGKCGKREHDVEFGKCGERIQRERRIQFCER